MAKIGLDQSLQNRPPPVWQFVGEERLQSTAMILITTGDPRRCDGHCGRLVKSAGDGVLLEFPSVVDAVECAAAVQAVTTERNQGVPQDRHMLFRIGINLGDILIEGDDILGDGVNIAARLEGVAEPGGICIS